MKILHVITSLQTGGAEMLVVNLMPRFKALGHEVGVVVFNGEHTALMERLEKECPECKIFRLGTGYYNPWYIIKLIGIMRKYDVVHTHNSSPQLYAAIANIFCRKRLITTEHNTTNRKRSMKLFAMIDKFMYPCYDRIICISDQTEENLREYLLNDNDNDNDNQHENETLRYENIKLKTNITTINNGVDVETIHKAEPIENMKSERFVIVMVAAFRPQKDQDTLIRAMAKLPKDQYEVWLVGDGIRRQSVEELVNSLDVKNNVKFLGLRTDVANILKTANVVVMSSHWEGFGLAAVEGMASAKPVVVSDVDGLKQITENYGLVFAVGDADALADIIRRLHDDENYYNEIAERCYARAKQFDISEMVARYNAVYCGTTR